MNAEPTRYCLIETPLGLALSAADADAITGFWFLGQRYFPQKTEHWKEDAQYPVLAALRTWLALYFAGTRPSPNFSIAPRGTPYQQEVWAMLLEIPYGQLTTYGTIAAQLNARPGMPSTSARAVGNAVAHNPISLLIPCHRVIGSTGNMTGYAGGLDKKQALLSLEGAVLRL